MSEKTETKQPSTESAVVEVIAGKSYLSRYDITMSANIEYVSKKGHIIANLESKGEEFTSVPSENGSKDEVPYPSETFTTARSFFETYYPSEEGKKVFKEFTTKMYAKL